MTIISFHDHLRALSAPVYHPTYELFWVKDKTPCSVSSKDKNRIHRQMISLAERCISASVYEDGFPIGYVGPGPKSRVGGIFDVVLFESRQQN